MEDQKQTKRKYIRFKPDPLDVALIDSRSNASDFQPTQVALILEESPEGCSLVFIGTTTPSVGTKLQIKVGNLDPLIAEVRWTKDLDPKVRAVGFHYES